MKKVFVIICTLSIMLSISAAKHYKPMVGGGVGFDFMHTSTKYGSDSDVGFELAFEGMVPLYNSLYARANLIGLRVGDNTYFEFGTGSSFGLVYFIPSRDIEPYGLGGLRIESSSSNGYSSTEFSISFGGGVQMHPRTMPMKPYAEMEIALRVAGGDYSYTTIGMTMIFGVRFGG